MLKRIMATILGVGILGLILGFVVLPQVGKLLSAPTQVIVSKDGGPPEVIIRTGGTCPINVENTLKAYDEGLFSYHRPYCPGEKVYWIEGYPYILRGDTTYYGLFHFWLVPEEYWEELYSSTDFSSLVVWVPDSYWNWEGDLKIASRLPLVYVEGEKCTGLRK